jgi:hypothetical protein
MDKTAYKILFPEEEITLESGEVVTVRPISFSKSLKFSKALGAIFEKFQKGSLRLIKDEDDKQTLDTSAIFETAGDEVITLMSIALDKPKEWFDTITPVDGLALAELIFKQNSTLSDSAKKNLQPLINRIKPIWETYFKSSSEQDIAGKTSKSIPKTK